MDRKMPTNTNKCKTFKQNWIKLNIGVDSPAMTRIVGGYWSWWQRQSSDIVSRRKLASSNLLLSRGSLARLSSGSRQTSLPHIMFLASILFLFFLPISFMLHHITYITQVEDNHQIWSRLGSRQTSCHPFSPSQDHFWTSCLSIPLSQNVMSGRGHCSALHNMQIEQIGRTVYKIVYKIDPYIIMSYIL